MIYTSLKVEWDVRQNIHDYGNEFFMVSQTIKQAFDLSVHNFLVKLPRDLYALFRVQASR